MKNRLYTAYHYCCHRQAHGTPADDNMARRVLARIDRGNCTAVKGAGPQVLTARNDIYLSVVDSDSVALADAFNIDLNSKAFIALVSCAVCLGRLLRHEPPNGQRY
jgi:hypothetical protein